MPRKHSFRNAIRFSLSFVSNAGDRKLQGIRLCALLALVF